MKLILLAGLLLASGCTTATLPPPPPDGYDSGAGGPPFSRAKTQQDIETSVRTKFGDALVDEAIASPAFLIAKHYPGMLPPPPPDAGRDYKYPDPPTAVLVRREGRWLAARAGRGFEPIAADKAAALDAGLAELRFWAEPAYAPPGCTDAGASLLWLKLPNRPTLVRQGTCGATGRTERIVFQALNA